MPDSALSTSFRIEIDGQALAAAIERSVLQVIVDDHLHLPDTCAIWLQETLEMDVAGQAHVDVGSKVKISVGALGDDTPQVLFEGEVTALEGEYRASKAPAFVIRGYDAAHRLMRGRSSKLFRQSKYSDIARQVAGAAGLQVGTIDDSRQVFEYVHQHNQTDLEFLRSLAKLSGFETGVSEGQFVFRRPVPAANAPSTGDLGSRDPLQLVFGQDLAEFHPRITAGGQVKKVTVRGWDVSRKEALVGESPAATTSAQLGDDPAALAGKFGDPELTSSDQPHASQEEVDGAAAALAEQIASAFVEATGKARGNPRIRAGEPVSISLVAEKFQGRYTITHTRHVFDLREGYQTHFEVSGRSERSLLGLASGGTSGGTPAASAGVQIGVVTDIGDPNNLGRVRVKLPYAGDDFVTDWARVAMPGAGPNRGLVWIPEVNDEVLVAFDHGSVRAPFVIGGLWNGQDAPPNLSIDNGALQERTFVSRTGQKIVLSDKDGSTGIKISSQDDSLFVHIDVDNKKIVITADSGGEVKVSSGGNFTIESQGSVKISGATGVEISSSAQTKVSGSSGLNLESSGVTAVKGSQVALG